LDLFSGIGGFSHGLKKAGGFRTVAYCEIEPKSQAVLQARMRDGALDHAPICRDITRLDGRPWRGKVDLITAGWPCQDLSTAGKRAGLSGERSGLFFEVVRLLDEIRPRWFLGENVPGLFSSGRGSDFLSALRALDGIGYGLAWRVLDAQNFGVPQRRRRVFVVGCLGAICPPEILFESEGGGGNSAAGRRAREGAAFAVRGGPGNVKQDGADNLICVTARQGKGGFTDPVNDGIIAVSKGSNPVTSMNIALPITCRDGDPVGITHTLTAKHGVTEDGCGRGTPLVVQESQSGLRQAMLVRRLTPIEVERLQGFPDRWTCVCGQVECVCPDSPRYRGVGNSVCVNVIEWIGRRLAQ